MNSITFPRVPKHSFGFTLLSREFLGSYQCWLILALRILYHICDWCSIENNFSKGLVERKKERKKHFSVICQNLGALNLQPMGQIGWIPKIDFPSQMVPCRFSLNSPLFGLGLSSKGRGSDIRLSSIGIALFHWTLDLAPSFKVTLKVSFH
jgi:hypothetical protein